MDSLPVEIVLYIAELCSWSSPLPGRPRTTYARAHSALARASRRYYSILNESLYRRNIKEDSPGDSCVVWAARIGRLETIKRARGFGADINPSLDASLFKEPFPVISPFERIGTPLHFAVANGHSDIVGYLLDQRVNVHTASRGFCSCYAEDGPGVVYPLHTAICNNKMSQAAALLRNGAFLRSRTTAALSSLAGHQRHDLVDIYLERGYPFSLIGNMRFAARRHYLKFAKQLLKGRPGDQDPALPSMEWTRVLHEAIRWLNNNDLSFVKMVLAQPGVDPSQTCEEVGGWMSLHVAAFRGRADVVKILLQEPGIAVNIRGGRDETPLEVAARYNHTDVIRLLLEHSPGDAIKLNPRGETLLHIVARSESDISDFTKTLNLLVEKGVPLNHVPQAGQDAPPERTTALHQVIIQGQHPLRASLMLKAGCDPSPTAASSNSTILHSLLGRRISLRSYQCDKAVSLTEELLAHGADLHAMATVQSRHGDLMARTSTPLFFAAALAQQKPCMEVLLKSGARTDSIVIDNRGVGQSVLTALFRMRWREPWCISKEAVIVVEERVGLLLKYRAPLGPVGEGMSALDYACQVARHGSYTLLRLLTKMATIDNIEKEHLEELVSSCPRKSSDDNTVFYILSILKKKLFLPIKAQKFNESWKTKNRSLAADLKKTSVE